ncbi:MAG: ferritin-like domain-containing protein [Acidobacteriia bacterium]|nr:ferritin-like domain-containing protein [Terriglobia bacterium]
MQNEKLESVYREELQDLYDAEMQIVNALPGMAQASSSPELKAAFELHLAETIQQVRRLEQVFAEMGEAPGSETSEGMRALLAEGRLRINSLPSSPVLDAALIAAAQKVEHYEISGYGTARTLAQMLNHGDAARLLQRTLDEEKETDSVLTEIAEAVIVGEELDDAETEGEEVAS